MLAPVELLKSTRLSGSSAMTGPLSLHMPAEGGRRRGKLGRQTMNEIKKKEKKS